MLLVTHKHEKFKLVHVSTHAEGQATNNHSTSSYVSKAAWAHKKHLENPSAQHNYDDGFQVTLIATGLCADDWTDTVEIVDDSRAKDRRKEIIQELEAEGYKNVGSSRTKTIRSLFTGLVGNNGWGKPYNKPQAKMRQDFDKIVMILESQGYEAPAMLFSDVYRANTCLRGLDGLILNTKSEVFEYIIQRIAPDLFS